MELLKTIVICVIIQATVGIPAPGLQTTDESCLVSKMLFELFIYIDLDYYYSLSLYFLNKLYWFGLNK